LVSLDLGLRYRGLCTDMATTVLVGPASPELKKLSAVTKKALESAIKECKAGAPISVIGRRVQDIAEENGFGVIRDLVGHGVGETVHEEPMVPNYYDRAFDKIIMKEGLVIAIEPMVTSGSGKSTLSDDGFSYVTADGKPAAHFEATVAITKKGVKILTPII